MALLAVAALLPDPRFCKQPKNHHFEQIFGCLQDVGSGTNTAALKILQSKGELTQVLKSNALPRDDGGFGHKNQKMYDLLCNA